MVHIGLIILDNITRWLYYTDLHPVYITRYRRIRPSAHRVHTTRIDKNVARIDSVCGVAWIPLCARHGSHGVEGRGGPFMSCRLSVRAALWPRKGPSVTGGCVESIFFAAVDKRCACTFYRLQYNYTPLETPSSIASKISVTPKGVNLPISKLHSILAVANLLAHNNKSQICYCGQISLQSAAVNCIFSDNTHLWG